jgi:hypothetical protein
MAELPYIDEHVRKIDAPPETIWAALVKVLGGMRGAAFARLLGADPASPAIVFAGIVGDTIPGFRVVAAERNRRLALEGCHRFSRYALTFLLDGDEVRAVTHAEFPGVTGRMYRAAVIGTGAHRVATRHILRQIANAV